MKPIPLLLMLMLLTLLCKQQKTQLDVPINPLKDSLLQNAKWELYKVNTDWRLYVMCQGKLSFFANYLFDTFKVIEKRDTFEVLFNMETSNCPAESTAKIVFENGKSWAPYYGVKYVSKVKHTLYQGRYNLRPRYLNDTLFANFLISHRDSITNDWLLNYAQRFLKNK